MLFRSPEQKSPKFELKHKKITKVVRGKIANNYHKLCIPSYKKINIKYMITKPRALCMVYYDLKKYKDSEREKLYKIRSYQLRDIFHKEIVLEHNPKSEWQTYEIDSKAKEYYKRELKDDDMYTPTDKKYIKKYKVSFNN